MAITSLARILGSMAMIIFAGAVAAGATGAFFSDTETSTGNTFTAGAIDLQIDNESFYNGVLNEGTTWDDPVDLTVEKFFNFTDVKPADYGEDTISIHVNDNDAWACVDVTLTANDDVDCTESENDLNSENGACTDVDADVDGVGDNGDNTDGDLAEEINFLFWADDGDNVLESGESIVGGGPINGLTFSEATTFALADSDENNLGETAGTPIAGGSITYLGKAWCVGSIAATPLAQAAYTGPDADNNDDTVLGSPADGGFGCLGEGVTNSAQTDRVTGDVSFRAEQARNNGGFQCVTL